LMLQSMEHAHIIRALDFFTTHDSAVLVMELYEGRPLDAAVRSLPRRFFGDLQARCLFGQLAHALEFLHRRGIIHRDIKGQNVLVSSDTAQPELRLVDFNVACHLADGSLTPTGTSEYFAPEIIAGQSASKASDIWAAGLCLQLMVSGRLPRRFDAFTDEDEFAAALGRPCSGQDGPSEQCLVLLRMCLSAQPASRPTAMALLSDNAASFAVDPETCSVYPSAL